MSIDLFWLDEPDVAFLPSSNEKSTAGWRLCYADGGSYWFTPDIDKQDGDGWRKNFYGEPYLPSRPGEQPIAEVRILAPNHEAHDARRLGRVVKNAQIRREIVLEHPRPDAHVRLGMTLDEARTALHLGGGRVCLPILIYRAAP